MVGVGQGVLGEDVHQLEEVVLDLVRLFIVGPVDCSKATVNVSRSNQGQAALEHFLEDDLTDSGLLLHVLLHELDEEQVNQNFEASRDLVDVAWVHKGYDALEGGA